MLLGTFAFDRNVRFAPLAAIATLDTLSRRIWLLYFAASRSDSNLYAHAPMFRAEIETLRIDPDQTERVAGGYHPQHRPFLCPGLATAKGIIMDAIFICAGLAFFAATVGYVLLCERL